MSLLANCMRRTVPQIMASRLASTASSQSAPQANFTPFNGEIPHEAIGKSFVLSSGPGGQNVQKNATKAQIRVRLDSSATWIDSPLRDAVAERLANRINVNGEVIIESDRTRERQLNLADAIDKLRSTIYDVQRELTSRNQTEEDVSLLRERAAKAARHRLADKRREQKKNEGRTGVDSI